MLTPPDNTRVESIVHASIHAILTERGDATAPIAGTDKLSATLGLTSLDLALLVAELEAELGVDPFARLVSVTAMRSVDDLVAAYRLALAPDTAPAENDAGLADAARRAATRRARLVGK